MNMDAVMCIDDMESKLGLQLLTEEPGREVLTQEYGIPEETVERLSQIFGISGVCNVLGAIKTAKFYGMGKDDLIVTICTDAIDRYHSVMASLNECFGPMNRTAAEVRLVSIFHRQKLDWIDEGTRRNRNQWHNLKYFTWIEQQGKSVGELDAQRGQDYWAEQQAQVEKVDRLIEEYRAQGA
jgi:hypothetical protein